MKAIALAALAVSALATPAIAFICLIPFEMFLSVEDLFIITGPSSLVVNDWLRILEDKTLVYMST